jgi:hypothetical protein
MFITKVFEKELLIQLQVYVPSLRPKVAIVLFLNVMVAPVTEASSPALYTADGKERVLAIESYWNKGPTVVNADPAVPYPEIEHPDTTKEFNLALLPANLILVVLIEPTLPNVLSPAAIAVGTVIDPVAVATTFAPDGTILIVTVPALTLVTPNKTIDRITNNRNRMSCIGNLM